jgi:hypothetical protein
MNTPRKYFAGYCPTPHEKSVVLGGALVLYPLTDPVEVASTLHIYTQRIWDAAYRQGVEDTQKNIRNALGLVQ